MKKNRTPDKFCWIALMLVMLAPLVFMLTGGVDYNMRVHAEIDDAGGGCI